MALADADEQCKAAILSLSTEPAPALHDVLQVCARKIPFTKAHQNHNSRVKPPLKAAADTVLRVPEPPPKRGTMCDQAGHWFCLSAKVTRYDSKGSATRETKSPHDLVTWGRGYTYVSTPPALKWVPAKWVKPFIPKTAKSPAKGPQVASAAWRRRKRRTFSF
ncbi:hypothetical protein DUI87_09149 [Hirundo rustica rustica]|uniref:Integrase-type domain-containing protein n=1 Tax=Hirundo rustica rustica TaxID=333673 RepID=A0A3M0KLD8_HIRRU|nr:hypothetical protein DUI87_09149 [Hirundo rustica rustica]